MLILASASSRRQELLRSAGIPFTVQPADVDETPLPRESARDCAERLARGPAVVVASVTRSMVSRSQRPAIKRDAGTLPRIYRLTE